MATSADKPWTPVRDELIRKCFGGVPTERIARVLGVPPARVRARAYALGVIDLRGERRDGRVPRIVEPPCKTRYTPLTEVQKDRACELAKTETFNFIMDELGVGKKALKLALEERGVVPPTKTDQAHALDEQIVCLAEQGMGRAEIAEAVGHAPSRVYKTLRERGYEQGRRPWGRAEVERLVELTRAGASRRDVARELGRTRAMVDWKLRQLREKGTEI